MVSRLASDIDVSRLCPSIIQPMQEMTAAEKKKAKKKAREKAKKAGGDADDAAAPAAAKKGGKKVSRCCSAYTLDWGGCVPYLQHFIITPPHPLPVLPMSDVLAPAFRN